MSISAVPEIFSVDKDEAKQRKWFQSGKNAKTKGFSRTSPFYENSTADYFFFCGFDEVSFEEAQKVLKEKLTELFNQDCTVFETVNELTK